MGAGLALVIGAILNYVVAPAGNPKFLFGGVLLICAAIAANALAYRGLSKETESGTKAGAKGIVLSLLCGVVIGLFYPFVCLGSPGRCYLGNRNHLQFLPLLTRPWSDPQRRFRSAKAIP